MEPGEYIPPTGAESAGEPLAHASQPQEIPTTDIPETEAQPSGASAPVNEPQTAAPTASATAPDDQPSDAPTEEPRERDQHGLPEHRVEVDVVAGDFTIRGGAPSVLLRVHDEDDAPPDLAEERDGLLRFAWIPGDSELRVPDGTELLVRIVEGDLDGEALDGILVVTHVAGDVELHDMAACDLTQVDGDLKARHSGSLRVRAVGGDVRVHDLYRAPLLGHIGGTFEASDLPGLELHESVGGDLTLDRCGDVTLLGTIGGDVRVEHSVVRVSGSRVGGDVRLSSVRGATLAAIGGDLKVFGATGPIEVSSIGGDAKIRNTKARVRLATVGGDLHAEDIAGGIAAGRIGGDSVLDTILGANAEYLIHTSGDISLRVRGDVNARFVAQTSGGEIRTRLPLTVEKGRRRNLVGVLGRGDATVTLRSDGGDITLAATDRYEEEQTMGDEFVGRDENDTERDERTWEGGLGRHRFRVRWDRGPGRTGISFKGPFTEDEDPDAMAGASRDFNFEWEKGRGPRMSGEYEERLNEMRDRAERVARKAAEQAQRYAEGAARRARETDWEGVGREVRTAIEKAMGDLEDTFTQLRKDWDTRRPSGTGPSAPTSKPSAQRVKIEYDDEATAGASEAPTGETHAYSQDDADAQRRAILEALRSGTMSLDEAERKLNELR